MSTAARPRAAFGTGRKNTLGVLFRSQTMLNAITASIGMFPSLPITLIAFAALITALSVSQQAATGTKAKGTASTRNTDRTAVWNAMLSLQCYVQTLCDTMSAEAATKLIEAAGMIVAKATTHQKDALAATLTTTPGLVHLAANHTLLVGKANVKKRATFWWEMSVNGGSTWTALPATAYASTLVSGLTMLSTYAFRVSVTVGNTPGTWSQAVSVLVH